MSIVWTLRKFTDAIQHREEEAARKRDLNAAHEDQSGDDNGEESAVEAQRAHYRCRVCDYRGARGDYCPECLADTMCPL